MKSIPSIYDYKVEVDADLTEKDGKYLYNKYKNFPFLFKHIKFKRDTTESSLVLTDHLNKCHTTISEKEIEPLLDRCTIKAENIKVELKFKEDRRFRTDYFNHILYINAYTRAEEENIRFNKMAIHDNKMWFELNGVIKFMVKIDNWKAYYRILETFLKAVKDFRENVSTVPLKFLNATPILFGNLTPMCSSLPIERPMDKPSSNVYYQRVEAVNSSPV